MHGTMGLLLVVFACESRMLLGPDSRGCVKSDPIRLTDGCYIGGHVAAGAMIGLAMGMGTNLPSELSGIHSRRL